MRQTRLYLQSILEIHPWGSLYIIEHCMFSVIEYVLHFACYIVDVTVISESFQCSICRDSGDSDDTRLCLYSSQCPFYHSAFLYSSSLVLQGCLIRRLNLLRYLQPIATPHWYTIFVFHHPLFLHSWKESGKAAHFHFKPFAGCSDANVLLRTLCSNLHKKNNSMNFYRLITGSGGTITFEGDGTVCAWVQLGLGLNT